MKISFAFFFSMMFLLMQVCYAVDPGIPQTVEISGKKVDVIINEPKSLGGPSPLLVIAPAKEYTMTGALFEQLAVMAAEAGYFVVRFNWGYVTTKTSPSPSLMIESQELVGVIEYFKKHRAVDPGRVVLAAKSFGSKVAMLEAYRKASALLLLTPNSNKENPLRKVYEPVFRYKGKVHIVISVDDPYGEISQLYEAMKEFGANVTVQTVVGDHNFKTGDANSEVNQKAVLVGCENWLLRAIP